MHDTISTVNLLTSLFLKILSIISSKFSPSLFSSINLYVALIIFSLIDLLSFIYPIIPLIYSVLLFLSIFKLLFSSISFFKKFFKVL